MGSFVCINSTSRFVTHYTIHVANNWYSPYSTREDGVRRHFPVAFLPSMMDSLSLHDIFQMEDLNMWISMPLFLAGMYSPHDNLSPVSRYSFLCLVCSLADLKYLLRYYKLVSVFISTFPRGLILVALCRHKSWKYWYIQHIEPVIALLCLGK